jgi:hypothetical protein
MDLPQILFALLRFALWEAALFLLALRLTRFLGWTKPGPESWLAVLSIQITLESSVAGALFFAHWNSQAALWVFAALAAGLAVASRPRLRWENLKAPVWPALVAALAAPLVLLSFKPVENIDSINYLHYMIDWMANRTTPYTFATGYGPFAEMSFAPSWMVTRVDLFFPLIALKSVLLVGLGAWLVGKELGVRRDALMVTVLGSLAMRHYWFQHSGVPTLKNDAFQGAGEIMLALAMLRGARRLGAANEIREERGPGVQDAALIAFGAAFASAKYSGVLFAAIAAVVLLWQWRGFVRSRFPKALAMISAICGFWLVTSGHYYLHTFLLHLNPFYPFALNFAFIHLPGTADLSYTSILYSLHDPRLWQAVFLPRGVSPAGLLFPLVLAVGLLASAWFCARAVIRRDPRDLRAWLSFAILWGWLIYFRSMFSASASPGDLRYVLTDLNSLRYAEGILALTEVFLVSLLAPRWKLAMALAGLNAASRLWILYRVLPFNVFPPATVIVCSVLVCLGAFALLRLGTRNALVASAAMLLFACPFLVERNRVTWTTYWNGLKPPLAGLPPAELSEVALSDGSMFAGHVVAAGNPVRAEVRSTPFEELAAMPATARPRYLTILQTDESPRTWRAKYVPSILAWGYATLREGEYGAIFEKKN